MNLTNAPTRLRSSIPDINVAIVCTVLIAALEAVIVFSNGGYFIDGMSLSAIAGWLLVIGLVVFGGSGDRVAAPWTSLLVIVPFFLFWIWTLASISWSIASDLSWLEANRTGGYLSMLIIGGIIGRDRRARRLAAVLFLLIATAAAVYTICVKAFPLTFENYKNMARVHPPIGYTNASGLMAALAVPFAIYFTSERSHHALLRGTAAIAAVLLPVAIIMTQSRGAVIALAFGIPVYFLLSPVRIRSFITLAVTTIPAVLILLWSSTQEVFTKNDPADWEKIAYAESLRLYLVAGVIVALLLTALFVVIDKRITFPKRAVQTAGAVILIMIVTFSAVAVTYFVSTREPSFTTWSSNVYSEFTTLNRDKKNESDLGHLASLSSSGRWQVWQEALESWRERPLAGHGAQSFPLTHLMKREPDVGFMKQPHGLMFRLLSELGIIGLLMFAAFLVSAMTLATLLFIKLRDRKDKGLAVSILSFALIYLVHTSFEWDWNMYALTMPFFLFAGVLTGWFEVAGKNKNV